MFEHNDGIRIVKGGLEQSFQVGAVGRIHHLDAPDVGEHRFDARTVVGAARSIGSDGNADEAVYGPLAVRQEIASAELREKLIEAGPEVICKLHFYDGAQSRG